ncbi:MAG: hypothetical protein ACOC0P_08030 [Planctomycetota bacterium]
MTWPTFAFFLYFLLAFEVGLRDSLAIGTMGIAPSFMLVYMVFIASNARAWTAVWAALTLGLLVDLTSIYVVGGDVRVVVGPYAIGYVAGALITIETRSVLYRRHPLTIAVQTLLAGIAVHLVVAIMLSMRQVLSRLLPAADIGFSTGDDLVLRFFTLLYSVGLAIPLGFLLNRLTPLFNFDFRPRIGPVR